jgi:hypothetical protein
MEPNKDSPAMRCKSGAISREVGTEPAEGVPPPMRARMAIPCWKRSSSVVMIPPAKCCAPQLPRQFGGVGHLLLYVRAVVNNPLRIYGARFLHLRSATP